MSHSLAPTPDDSAEPRRPLLSSRYGYHTDTRGIWGHLSARHCHDRTDECEADQRFRCSCPPRRSKDHRCCARATAEDRLCGACRDYCLAIDRDGVYHRFIDLASSSTTESGSE